MNHIKLLTLIALIVSGTFACKSQTVSGDSPKNQSADNEILTMNPTDSTAFAREARKRFSDNFKTAENRRFILCFQEEEGTVMRPQNSIDYFVFDKKEGRVCREGNVFNGSIEWYDEERLEIYSEPGMIQEGQTQDDLTLILNVLSGERIQKSEFQSDKTEESEGDEKEK